MFKEKITMKKRYLVTAFILAGLQLSAAEQKVGIVNIENIITETKLAKQEQASFETMRKQFSSLLEDTDKQLRDINDKLQDKDYLDGLSPEAEQEMKTKFAQLSEEMQRYNQQYYGFMQQGQQKMAQVVFGALGQAAEKIAAAKGYTMILNKQACFYSAPTLDVTTDMIKEMDKNYEDEAKKQPTAGAAAPAATQAASKTEVPAEAKKQTAAPAASIEEAKKPAVATNVEEKKSAAEAPKPR